MARGLSDLQKCILELAYENRAKYQRENGMSGADLYTYEVFIAVYGFDGAYPEYQFAQKPDKRTPNHHHFRVIDDWWYLQKVKPVEASRYASAGAAVSKAFKRLERRGLVVIVRSKHHHWTGVNLTEQGVLLAMSQKLPRDIANNSVDQS